MVPAALPSVDVIRIEVEVEQDSRTLYQSAKENMRAEKVALPNELADRKRDAERLRDDLAGHALVVRKQWTVGLGRGDAILLHCGTDKLIEVKEECLPEVRLVIGRKYNRNRFGLHVSFLLAGYHSEAPGQLYLRCRV